MLKSIHLYKGVDPGDGTHSRTKKTYVEPNQNLNLPSGILY
jgi:hypothetical protein